MSYYDYIRNIINTEAFINTDTGIIFEFTAARASQLYTIDPIINDNLGFGDVSAIAVYNIPSAILDKLFYFQLASVLDINNINVIKYGINPSYTFDILFSNAITSYSSFTLNSPIKIDYVSYLAFSTLGTPNINIFSNKNQLINTVVNMDTGFNNTINQNIAYCGVNNTGPFLSNDMNNPFAHSSKQLVSGLLTLANTNRRQIFFNDLLVQSRNQIQYPGQHIYWVQFHPGDKMSILINYLSKSGLKPRSYKIILNCIGTFIFPSNASNVAFNSAGNLDPFYILNLVNQEIQSNQINYSDQLLELNSSFVSAFNTIASNPSSILFPYYKQLGDILNPLDLYYKTFLSNLTQPSILNQNGNGILNNGINPSFQYIYLNSTITTITYPSLRTIKQSLLRSPYGLYPTLNDIKDIRCDLTADPANETTNFIIRIYTRPIYTGIDNSFNPNDTFYGNYYDSLPQISNITSEFTYNLNALFPSWSTMLISFYNQVVYYNDGLQLLYTYGQQQILSICVMTYDINANIGIKNIIVTYK